MAATTGQLGLPTPTQGTLSGTWGDTVNNGITEYTNLAIAATLTLTGDGAVTLANTTGSASAANITSTLAGAGTVTAQHAIVQVSGTTGAKVITGPSYSKTYVVDNVSSFAVTFKASGQAGITIAAAEKCTVYFNGTDYIKVASSLGGGSTISVANGGTSLTTLTANNVIIGNGTSAPLFVAPSTSGNVLTSNGTTWVSSAGASVSAATPTALGTVYGMVSTANSNYSIGQNSLGSGSLTGTNNIAMGQNAGLAVTSGQQNTSIGSGSGSNLTTGSNNILIGYNATASAAYVNNENTFGSSSSGSNRFWGSFKLGGTDPGIAGQVFTSTGSSTPVWAAPSVAASTPTTLGTSYGLSTNSYGLSLGNGAGASLPAVSESTAIGISALSGNSSGSQNTAVGYGALPGSDFSSCTAVGAYALSGFASNSGNNNCAFGRMAMVYNTTGSGNSAFGRNTLGGQSTADDNSAFGIGAGLGTTNGGQNVYLGSFSAQNGTTANGNICIGYAAGNALTTGSGNISIGDFAPGAGIVPAFSISTQNNRISMGSTSVTNAYIQVGWTTVSDARDKINFGEVPHGLDFVKQLQPVSYQFKASRENETPVGDVKYGFRAQDILALEGANSVIIDSKKEEKLYYNADSLVPVLVKALQELSAKFDAYVATHP